MESYPNPTLRKNNVQIHFKTMGLKQAKLIQYLSTLCFTRSWFGRYSRVTSTCNSFDVLGVFDISLFPLDFLDPNILIWLWGRGGGGGDRNNV